MLYDYDADPRIDPRMKAILKVIPPSPEEVIATREEMVERAASPTARAMRELYRSMVDGVDREEVASFRGLVTTDYEVTSAPDGNTINVRVVRPDDDEVRACVYYIHGGAMATLSCFDGNYRAWARLVAAEGVVVVMVDFRNCVAPSSVPDVAPFPSGLNDCVAGLKWVHERARDLGVDPSRVVVAGESGGGNLSVAVGLTLKQLGELDLIKGLYLFCPYLVGEYPVNEYPSTVENNGIFIDVRGNGGAIAYGIDAFDARDPRAWPGFATLDDVRGFPPTVVSVNECDPLRDEGVAFYRLLLEAGVAARGRVVLGTSHATEVFVETCPDITRDAARDLAAFATV